MSEQNKQGEECTCGAGQDVFHHIHCAKSRALLATHGIKVEVECAEPDTHAIYDRGGFIHTSEVAEGPFFPGERRILSGLLNSRVGWGEASCPAISLVSEKATMESGADVPPINVDTYRAWKASAPVPPPPTTIQQLFENFGRAVEMPPICPRCDLQSYGSFCVCGKEREMEGDTADALKKGFEILAGAGSLAQHVEPAAYLRPDTLHTLNEWTAAGPGRLAHVGDGCWCRLDDACPEKRREAGYKAWIGETPAKVDVARPPPDVMPEPPSTHPVRFVSPAEYARAVDGEAIRRAFNSHLDRMEAMQAKVEHLMDSAIKEASADATCRHGHHVCAECHGATLDTYTMWTSERPKTPTMADEDGCHELVLHHPCGHTRTHQYATREVVERELERHHANPRPCPECREKPK